MTPILSILIPTLPDRMPFLNEMLSNHADTFQRLAGVVEVRTDARGPEVTTGAKRNALLRKARGKYVWQVDDDDYVYPYAFDEILKAAEQDPDVIGINGIMTTDGVNEQGWEIRLGHPFIADIRNGKEYYLRFPNHITPMKREHALKVQFENRTIFEDYHWACALKDLGVLKTQVVIDKPVYHYRVRSKK